MGGSATELFLPIALGVIMLGLGLSLTPADFKRVVLFPRAVIIGLICQMLVLPVVCFGIARAFALPPELAVGLMLLAASPGGATANLYSHLAKGDVALNITLTAVNSVGSIVTMPLIVGFAMQSFMSQADRIPLQFGKLVQVFAFILVPVVLGMILRAIRPAIAHRLERPVKIVSAVFLVLVILGVIVGAAFAGDAQGLSAYLWKVAPAALVFNLASMGVGYFIPRLLGVPERQAVAIGMEIGIHNGALAIALATTLLGSAVMAMPAAIYSMIMFVTAAAFGWIVSRRIPMRSAPIVIDPASLGPRVTQG